MKNRTRKNFILALSALAVSLALFAGAVYAWFVVSREASGSLELNVGGDRLGGELYLGQDFNRDGLLDRDPASGAELYTEYAAVTGLLPTQVVTLKLTLKSSGATENADVTVRLSGAFAAGAGDTVTWFDLVELTAESGGGVFAMTRDATAKAFFNVNRLSIPRDGVDLILRFTVATPGAGAQFDWSNVYQSEFRAAVTVTAR